MTKLPRDVSGQDVIKALRKFGLLPCSSKGFSRYSYRSNGENDNTVPLHKSLKTGLLRAIIREVGISVKVFIELLEDP